MPSNEAEHRPTRSVGDDGQLNVTVLLLDGNYASTALGPIEVFHSAGALWNTLVQRPADPRFRVGTASIDGRSVGSPYGVAVTPQMSIDDVGAVDLIVVPASGLDLDAQLARHRALLPWLVDWHARGAYVASVCTGAAYLAEAGLLDGREATTHWALAEAYAQRYPAVKWHPERFVTEDQRVLCSGGVYAAIDLSLYLVEKFCGHDIALGCAKSLLVDMPRHHQSGYAVLPLSRPHTDAQIRAAEVYIDQNYARSLTVERLAEHVTLSPRTFIRRFKAATGQAPATYLRALRVSIAREMLEETRQSVDAVSRAVGYEDVAYFRSIFKRMNGVAPADYRARFGRTNLRLASG
jgi:transcriptional regulator GlxA family with amidase domain